jgi:quercetin dioxygenase-like cupin family protein
MSHEQSTDEVRDRAILYALGVLEPADVAAFEAHLAEGCRTCVGEVQAFHVVSEELGYAAAAVRPDAEVRERLLARVRAGMAEVVWTVVPTTERPWEARHLPGLEVRRLDQRAETGRFTALARMEAGLVYPGHRHVDTEELYLLAGDLSVDGHLLGPGDYCAAPPGTIHYVTATRGGCTFLLHASERDQVLESTASAADQQGLVFVHAHEGSWEAASIAGVTRRLLLEGRVPGTRTALIRMEPGVRLPRHQLHAPEQFYVLEGEAHVTGHVLGPGDYYCAAPGTVHEDTFTEAGCVILLIASPIDVFT